ncbi:hypothetical protein GQ44DRAFT_696254 [Phaeosphaeriaceae sp. PMI808]|nr:hypothetical protein GQ44DRAFT_696254 [Phaeosphaeriaceae sp. PMI808]
MLATRKRAPTPLLLTAKLLALIFALAFLSLSILRHLVRIIRSYGIHSKLQVVCAIRSWGSMDLINGGVCKVDQVKTL